MSVTSERPRLRNSDKRKQQPAEDVGCHLDEGAYPSPPSNQLSRPRPRTRLKTRTTFSASPQGGFTYTVEDLDSERSVENEEVGRLQNGKGREHVSEVEEVGRWRDRPPKRIPQSKRRTNSTDCADSSYGSGGTARDNVFVASPSPSERSRYMPLKSSNKSSREPPTESSHIKPRVRQAKLEDYGSEQSAVSSAEEADVPDEQAQEVGETISSNCSNADSDRSDSTQEAAEDEGCDSVDDPEDDFAHLEIRIRDNNKGAHKVRALLDTGTKPDWISLSFVRKLDLKLRPLNEEEKKRSFVPFEGPKFNALGKVKVEMISESFEDFILIKDMLVKKSDHFRVLIGCTTIARHCLLSKGKPEPTGEGSHVALQSPESKEQKKRRAEAKAASDKLAAAQEEKHKAREDAAKKKRAAPKHNITTTPKESSSSNVNFAKQVKADTLSSKPKLGIKAASKVSASRSEAKIPRKKKPPDDVESSADDSGSLSGTW